MKTKFTLALVAGITWVLTSGQVRAQESVECAAVPECHGAWEIQQRVAGMTAICGGDAEHERQTLALLQDAARARHACEQQNITCGHTLRQTQEALAAAVAIIANGCGGGAIAATPDAVCRQICEARGHGEWHAADGDTAAFCEPHPGYRIANRCRPVRQRTGGGAVTPPPRPGVRCNEAIDTDRDGVPDVSRECIPVDNCSAACLANGTCPTANRDQADRDTDGEGDVCDDDDLEAFRAELNQLCATPTDARPVCVLIRGMNARVEPEPVDLSSILSELERSAAVDQDIRTILNRHRIQIEGLLGDVAALRVEDAHLLERITCLRQGRDFRVEGERIVCTDTCIDPGLVWNAETRSCDALPVLPGEFDISVGPAVQYWDGTFTTGAALDGTWWFRSQVGWTLWGYAGLTVTRRPELHVTVGTGPSFRLVESDGADLDLGIGAFGTNGTDLRDGTNGVSTGFGAYADLALSLGDDDSAVRSRIFVRGMAGYADADQSAPHAAPGLMIGVQIEF